MTRMGFDLCVRFNSFLYWLALHTPVGRRILRACGSTFPGLPGSY
jgi:hypothetical protein